MTEETKYSTDNGTNSISSPVYRDGLRAQIELLDELSQKLDEYFMLTRFREDDTPRR